MSTKNLHSTRTSWGEACFCTWRAPSQAALSGEALDSFKWKDLKPSLIHVCFAGGDLVGEFGCEVILITIGRVPCGCSKSWAHWSVSSLGPSNIQIKIYIHTGTASISDLDFVLDFVWAHFLPLMLVAFAPVCATIIYEYWDTAQQCHTSIGETAHGPKNLSLGLLCQGARDSNRVLWVSR